MHILPEKLRSDARRTIPYACASVLAFQTDCTIVKNPFYGCKFVQKVGA
ncbi:MAG: hypothetical protein JWO47_147 [Candidatus Saccharibacteria bacterium]|nr:hypothetical protein [Candidatus Saccharibacteria bacterium]